MGSTSSLVHGSLAQMGKECCSDEGCYVENSMVSVDALTAMTEAETFAERTGNEELGEGRLDGNWYRLGDRLLLGRIEKNRMIWNRRYMHEPSRLKFSGDKVCMVLDGETHSGRVVLASTAGSPYICWSDGQMWTMSEQASK
eukprot:TRINITY_DN81629_c0_g1_i1.p1 TRINITY_DN81629_c0_g1~~TRINITY_DN81629_c0_g1_i1.p1  ORF type:complete len:153 (-),score=28.93 TRINITY_DN81629_c0_g1_i1:21-446(-)